MVPGYHEVRRLGTGGAGRVVLATYAATGAYVAIRFLRPLLWADPGFLARFREEAGRLVELESPHVVRLHEYVETPTSAALVMELVDGVSLRTILTERGTTSPEAALALLRGSLLGLAAAHDAGIAHRAYRPENVLVQADGAGKIADFGLALPEGPPPYPLPAPVPTAGEAPPDGGVAADLYAATCVFVECLTGRPPQDDTLKKVPGSVRELVADGLSPDPAVRPATAREFIEALERAAGAAYGAEWEKRGPATPRRTGHAARPALPAGGPRSRTPDQERPPARPAIHRPRPVARQGRRRAAAAEDPSGEPGQAPVRRHRGARGRRGHHHRAHLRQRPPTAPPTPSSPPRHAPRRPRPPARRPPCPSAPRRPRTPARPPPAPRPTTPPRTPPSPRARRHRPCPPGRLVTRLRLRRNQGHHRRGRVDGREGHRDRRIRRGPEPRPPGGRAPADVHPVRVDAYATVVTHTFEPPPCEVTVYRRLTVTTVPGGGTASRTATVRGPACAAPAVLEVRVCRWNGSAGTARVTTDGPGPVRLGVSFTRREGDGPARTVHTDTRTLKGRTTYTVEFGGAPEAITCGDRAHLGVLVSTDRAAATGPQIRRRPWTAPPAPSPPHRRPAVGRPRDGRAAGGHGRVSGARSGPCRATKRALAWLSMTCDPPPTGPPAGAASWSSSAVRPAIGGSTSRRPTVPGAVATLVFEPVSGAGVVHTFTVVHRSFVPALPGPRAVRAGLGRPARRRPRVREVVGCAPEEVRIGMPVRVTFVDDLPHWRPA